MAIRRQYNRQYGRHEFEIEPALIPATPQVVTADDVHLLDLQLVTNVSATVNVTDGNGVAIIPTNKSLTAGDTLILEFNGRLCPGGISWTCSNGAAVVGYARWW